MKRLHNKRINKDDFPKGKSPVILTFNMSFGAIQPAGRGLERGCRKKTIPTASVITFSAEAIFSGGAGCRDWDSAPVDKELPVRRDAPR